MNDDLRFNFRVLNSVVATAPATELFPDNVHVGVFPCDFGGYRLYTVPAKRNNGDMLVDLHLHLPARHRALRIVEDSIERGVLKCTLLYDTSESARRNDMLFDLTSSARWKGDVVVLKHCGARDDVFDNVTSEDMERVMKSLSEMPK